MSPLQSLQSDFQSYLLHGGEKMRARVTGTAKVDTQTRLAIYFDAFRLRLLEALDSNYPVLHIWMGDEAFEEMGRGYLGKNPSRHFSIRYFGHRLADYLIEAPEYRDKPYLGEMARLEWAMSEAFDAADEPIMNVAAMANQPAESWPAMRLRFHPTVRRLDLRWNVPAVWKAIKADDVPEPPEVGEWPQPWLVWRQDLKTYYRSLSVDEAWALDRARAGEPFAAICEGLCEWIDAEHVATRAVEMLKQWVMEGMITAADAEINSAPDRGLEK